MAESSRHDPANSNTITQAEYEDMMTPHDVSGVIGTLADTAIVYADGSARAVKIRANKKAKVRGRVWYNDAAEVQLAIAANASGSTRIDTVVLRLYRASQGAAPAPQAYQVRAFVVQGTPGAGAPALTLQTAAGNTFWDLPLTNVTVANGAAVINAGNLTSREHYIGGDGSLLSVPGRTRPQGIGAGQRLIEVPTTVDSSNPIRELWWDGTQWRLAADQSLFDFWSMSGSLPGLGNVTGSNKLLYTSPDIGLEANQAYRVGCHFPFLSGGYGNGTYFGNLRIEHSTDAGATWTRTHEEGWQTFIKQASSAAGFISFRAAGLYKAGSNSTVRFRVLLFLDQTGLAYDIGSASSGSAFTVTTTGKLSAEVA